MPSFWDRLDDAYDDATGSFSDGFSTALHFTNNIFSKIPYSSNVAHGAGNAMEAVAWGYSNAVARPTSTFFQNLQPHSPFSSDYWNMPSFDIGGNVERNIVEPWQKTGYNVTDAQGNPVEGISPGQALVGALGGDEFAMDPKSVQERKEFFHNTAFGQLSSGAIDATVGWYADPFVLGAKGAKAIENAGRTTTDTRKVAEGFEQIRAGAPKSATARNANVSIVQLSDATPEQVWAHPALKDDQSGALASSIIEVNKRFADDEVARADAVRDLFGSATGDVASRERLGGKAADLRVDLDQLQQAPAASRYADAWSFDDAGRAADDLFTDYANEIHNVKIKEIEDELSRLDSVSNVFLSRTRGTNKENLAYAWRNRRLSQTYLPTSKHGRMVRVVGNALSNRLPGHVNIRQAREGWNDVDEYLKQSKYTDNGTKLNLLNEFGQATNPNERTIASAKIEAQVFADYAHKHGITREAAELYYRAGVMGRDHLREVMSGKLTEAVAQDRRSIAMFDPAADEAVSMSTDLARKVGEDYVPMMDPEVLDDILKVATHQRALEKMARKRTRAKMRAEGYTPERIHAELELSKPGTKANDLIDDAWDGTKDALRQLVGVWKFATLFRPAYMPRVQIDSQLRLMTYIGETQAMASILNVVPGFGGALSAAPLVGKYVPTKSGRELAKAYRSSKHNDRIQWSNVFSDPDYADALRDRFTKPQVHNGVEYTPFVNEHEYQQFIDDLAQKPGSGMQDVLGELTRIKLARSRQNQSFTNITGADAGWADGYKRRVNEDILGSPIARQVLLNADHGQAIRAIKADAKAMEEWSYLKGGDSLDEYVARQRQFIDHYLPEESTARLWASEEASGRVMDVEHQRARLAHQKATSRVTGAQKAMDAAHDGASIRAAGKSIRAEMVSEKSAAKALIQSETDAVFTTWDDVVQSFGEMEAHHRPLVMSDEYTPYNQSKALKAYNATRKAWFQFAGEAPETVLARSPLWNHAFNNRMHAQIDRAKATGQELDLTAARANAAAFARKEVGRTLFDVSHASNLSQTMSMVMPFFAAWEDVMKKWWGLLYDKPWIAPRGMQIKDAPNDAGLVYDSEGNLVTAAGEHLGEDGKPVSEEDMGKGEFITLPGKWVPGNAKGDLRVNKNALNIVFQGEKWYLPGFGPLVQVPTNEYFKRHYPEEADQGFVKFLLPFGIQEDDPAWQTAPGWVRSLHDYLGKTDNFNAQANRLLQVEADRFVNGERDAEPTLDEIMTRTRNWYILKMFLQSSAPVSTQPVPDNRAQFYIDKVRWYQRQYGPTAMEKFYSDFPEHFMLSYSITSNETGVQASALARKEMVKYRGDVDVNPEYGWAIVGPANDPQQPWNQGVYTSQLTTDIGPRGNKSRVVKPVGEAQEDILRSKGWTEYNQGKMQLQDELDKRGLNSVRQKGAEDLKDMWDGYVAFQKRENPVWAADFGSYDTGKVEQLVRVMNDGANKHKDMANRTDVRLLKEYLRGREEVKSLLAGREFKSLDHPSNVDIAQSWDGYVRTLTSQNVAFEFMVNRVLSHDTFDGDIVWSEK